MIDRNILGKTPYEDEVEYFFQYANEDWVMTDLIYGSVSIVFRALGKEDAPLLEKLELGNIILKDLFDRGVVIGDLIEGPPGFKPWDGGPSDWLARVQNWIISHNRLPDPIELGWLHVPKEGRGW
jgi:hypothetical protein